MIAVVSTVVKRCQCNMQHIIFRRYQHRLACCRVPAMQATASSPPSPTLCHVLLLCATFSYCSITFSFAPPELSPTPRRTTFSYSYFSSITFSNSSITSSSNCTLFRSHTSREAAASSSFCIPALHNIILLPTTFSISSSFLQH